MIGSTVPSKIEVNAAIVALLGMSEGDDWEPHAATVIAYAKSFPKSSHVQVKYRSTVTSDRDSFVGHTAEAGDVRVDDEHEGSHSESISFGEKQDRVGHFKLTRLESEKGGLITIKGFWKSDIETSADEDVTAPLYYLRYGIDSRPEYFGKIGDRIIICFVLFATRYKLTRRFVAVSLPKVREIKNGIGISIRSVDQSLDS